MTPPPTRPEDDKAFIRRLLIALSIVAAALFLWKIVDVLLLAFGAVLIAVLLDTLARPIAERSPLSRRWSLAVAIAAVLALLGLFAWVFGAQLQAQLGELAGRIPQAWQTAKERLGVPGLQLGDLQNLLGQNGALGTILPQLGGALVSAFYAIGDLMLVAIGAVFLAAQPGLYRRGLLMLFPDSARPQASDALDSCGNALRLWLLGQLISMALIGTLTGLLLWLLGVPSALALGLIAGVFEFVPLVGPILAAIPALLVALTESTTLALWVLGAYLLVQQVESNLVMPLVQRRMVQLPPALTLFAVVAMGIVFGTLGLFLATPLTVVAYVAVKKLYVRQALGEETEVPGESQAGR